MLHMSVNVIFYPLNSDSFVVICFFQEGGGRVVGAGCPSTTMVAETL